MLNSIERKKYEVIKNVVDGVTTRKEASAELKLSLKQIDRLKQIYETEGEQGFVHKNRGRLNPNKKDNKLIEELENLYLTEYDYYNFAHFYDDVIFGKYNISYNTLLKYFTSDDIISPCII